MVDTKKKPTATKKDLIKEIGTFTDQFELTSLGRTNIANLQVIRNMLKG
tara:strand:- start:35 stop:181 length:147 start_codon:yes stop_codon:yes gene_type:complete